MRVPNRTKHPPKSKVMKENNNLRIRVIELELQLERLNRAWEKKFSLLAGIFEAELENAGTLGELRRWFKEWNERLDAIDPNDPDADAKMQAMLDEYDLELVVTTVPEEMVEQENQR